MVIHIYGSFGSDGEGGVGGAGATKRVLLNLGSGEYLI